MNDNFGHILAHLNHVNEAKLKFADKLKFAEIENYILISFLFYLRMERTIFYQHLSMFQAKLTP